MKRVSGMTAIFCAAVLIVFAGFGCDSSGGDDHANHNHTESEAVAHEHGEDCNHDNDTDSNKGKYETFLAAGKDEHEHDGEVCDGDHDSPSCIVLGEIGSSNLGVTTTVIRSEIYYDQIKIPGTLAADPDRLVEVSAPAMVRVVELFATPPSVVRAGERLAILELADPEVRGLQMDAVETRAELIAGEIERDRLRRYLESLQAGSAQSTEIERITSEVQISEARVQAQQSALSAQLSSLKVAGLSKDQLDALEESGVVATRIEVFAPQLPDSPTLEVADRPISLGETIGVGETLFSLVALDELRVIGEAFEADLAVVRNALRERLPVNLLFPAEDCMVKGLTIESLEGALDGVNRTTHFFVRLVNPVLSERESNGLRYQERRHGAGCRAQILVATQDKGQRIIIPSSALIAEGGEVYAFIKEPGGYERIAVNPESIDGRLAILPLDGHLHPGEALVVQGALQLNLLWHEQNSSGGTTIDPHAGHSH